MGSQNSYVLMVLSSFCITFVMNILKLSPGNKKYIYAICGLLQVFWFCGIDSLHFIIMVCAGTFLVTLSKSPRVVFVYCFAHRIFFSLSMYFGFKRDESNLANALMLVTTVKMITVAYEISEFSKKKLLSNSENTNQTTNGHVSNNNVGRKKEMLLLYEPVSTLDVICYMSCFAGLFTGPLFRYRTYYDMLNSPSSRNYTVQLVAKIKIFVAVLIVYIVGTSLIDPNYLKDDKFYAASLTHRFSLIVPSVFVFQLKYSVVWVAMELSYILLGFGAYPVSSEPRPGHGPTKLDAGQVSKDNSSYCFDAIINIRPVQVITETTFRETFYSWNCCVQWWLAYHVYASSAIPRKYRILRILNTMLVCSIWHGIKPGYYISFLSVPFITMCEEICERNVRSRLQSESARRIYDVFNWITFKMYCFSFLFGGFMLLQLDAVLRLYKSLYFYGYLFPITMVVVSFLFKKIVPKEKTK